MSEVKREHLAGLELAYESLEQLSGFDEQRLCSLIAQAIAAPEQEAVAYCDDFTLDILKRGAAYSIGVEPAKSTRRSENAIHPLYTDPSAEIERLRAENKRLDLALAQADHNYDCDRQQFEQKLAEVRALLAKSVASVRYQQGMQSLDHDAGRAHEKRFANLADAIDAFLSATAQPAEVKS